MFPRNRPRARSISVHAGLVLTLLGLPQEFGAYRQLRQERTNQRLSGKRAKRAAELAAEEKDKAK